MAHNVGAPNRYSRLIIGLTLAGELLAATARLHDLTIVPQPDLDHDSHDNATALDIMMGSGGPTLLTRSMLHAMTVPTLMSH